MLEIGRTKNISIYQNYFQASINCFVLSCLSVSCSGSMYKFQSQPLEASVYYINGGDKTAIGLTPIDYTKASLPTDAPFTILFEKAGYESREVTVSPTDNSQTTISTTLKASKEPNSDAATKKTRDILRKFFEVQELTAQQRFVDALAILSKLEDTEPAIAEVASTKGSIYLLLNDQVQARKQWEKALKIDPTLEQLRVKLKGLSSDKSSEKIPDKKVGGT